MRSLIRKHKTKTTVPLAKAEHAQCCAKVSKTVAGCHD
jgi:hypothetical protein